MRYYGVDKPGMKVGVLGLGGLGHMAVKFGKAMGMEVTVISSSAGKREEAVSRLGADRFLLSTDEEEMKKAMVRDTWFGAMHIILPIRYCRHVST